MVRRLIQQQQIRLDHQQPRKVRPHHPTTTEFPRRPREILFLVPEPAQNLPRPRLRLRILQRLMLRLRIKIRRRTHIPALLMLLKNRLQSIHLPGLPSRNVQHRLLTHRLTLLRQIPQRGPLITVHLPGIRRVRTQNQRKQRGLACPVRTDQRHPLAVIHRHVRPLKKHAGIERLGDFADREHGIVFVRSPVQQLMPLSITATAL